MHVKTTLKAFLVDDEQLALKNLHSLLEQYCPSIEVIGFETHLEAAADAINRLSPDVVFLDINLNVNSGFDLIPLLKKKHLIVFVTAFDKYVLQALRISAVDYLLKPIDLQELVQTEIRLNDLIAHKVEINPAYQENLSQLAALKSREISLSKITLPSTSGFQTFELKNLLCIKGSDNYSIFYFDDKPETVVARTLKNYEEMLKEHGFMRVHKSYLVQLKHVKTIRKKESMELTLSNGIKIPVSRRKVAELMDWYKIYGQSIQ